MFKPQWTSLFQIFQTVSVWNSFFFNCLFEHIAVFSIFQCIIKGLLSVNLDKKVLRLKQVNLFYKCEFVCICFYCWVRTWILSNCLSSKYSAGDVANNNFFCLLLVCVNMTLMWNPVVRIKLINAFKEFRNAWFIGMADKY